MKGDEFSYQRSLTALKRACKKGYIEIIEFAVLTPTRILWFFFIDEAIC